MPKKVVRIIDRLNAGGPAKHVVWLSSGLAPGQFETVLITGTCAHGETDMSFLAQAAGLKPLVIPSMSREIGPRDLLVILRLIRELFRLKPDIVHTHKSKAGTAGRIAALVYRWISPSTLRFQPRSCKIVHTYHGHIFHSYYGRNKTWLFLNIERMLARLCTDRIVVISELQRREISGRFRVGRPDQMRVIPLGINMDELPVESGSSLREALGVASDELLIGMVGRLTEVKNHSMLLQSAKELLRMLSGSGLRARFVIVGDGHLRPLLEKQAEELGLSGDVLFTGFRSDVLSLYPSFDVLALTSLNEGTPLTMIEAMACGRPAVTTEVGGVADLLGELHCKQDSFSVWDHGLSVQSRDVAGFAQALKFIAERPELRRQMGDRARAFARVNFSRERLLRDFTELYRELTGEPGLRPQTAVQAVADSHL